MYKSLPLLALLFSISLFAQLETRLDSIVQSKIQPEDPALMVGVVKDGKVIYQSIRGVASLQHKVPASKDTRSNIASTAKQFTALMILDLSQQGKLDLEADIRLYFPELYPNVKDTIRIRHLLNHTSGIRDYCDLMSIQQDPWWRREGLDNEDVLDLLTKQEDLAFKPGAAYTYSNSGYTLLADLIERVTEESFHRYSEKFFQNLGMIQTAFLEDYMYIIPNQALPYSDWGDGVWQQYPTMTNTYGEGFLFTTLEDQLHYEQLVQKAAADRNELILASQQPIPNSERKHYGFGLELSETLGYPSVHHAGGTGSYGSQMLRFPEQRLSIFVMSSNSQVYTGGLALEIAKIFLKEKEKAVEYSSKINSISKEKLTQSIVGQYRSASGKLNRIEEEEGKLKWKYANQYSIPIYQDEENVYHPYYNEDEKIGVFENEVILFDTEGDETVFTRLESMPPSLSDLKSYEGDYYSSELEIHFDITLKDGQLFLNMDDWKTPDEIQVLRRDEMLSGSWIIEAERDAFDRVIGMLITENRAGNVRFDKKTNLHFQPTIATENGSISVTTIGSVDGSASDILLTRNYENGNEIWTKQFGGSSYDKASSLIETEDGYLIIGSTSSYGNGNYDVLLIKTNKKGKKKWQKTFGKTMNDYGYYAEVTAQGYLIKGTTQECVNDDVFNCKSFVWILNVDEEGNELSNEVREQLN